MPEWGAAPFTNPQLTLVHHLRFVSYSEGFSPDFFAISPGLATKSDFDPVGLAGGRIARGPREATSGVRSQRPLAAFGATEASISQSRGVSKNS